MANSTANDLARTIQQLQTQRQQHIDAIAMIDEIFGQYGIKTSTRRRRRGAGRSKGSVSRKKAKRKVRKKVGKKRGRKKVAKKRGRKKAGRKTPGRKKSAKKRASKKKRTRRGYSKTGDQFILDMLKGGKKLTTSEINSRWKQARRGGNADNTLSKLKGLRKIRRQNIKGGRGSRYSLA